MSNTPAAIMPTPALIRFVSASSKKIRAPIAVLGHRAALHRLEGGTHDADHPIRQSATDIRTSAADPGYPAADLNGHTGPQTVTEGTDAFVGLPTEKPGAGSGRFVRPNR